MTELVLIWSFEHNAWWGPESQGYVANAEEAGLYSRTAAEQIVANANRYCEEGKPNEEIRPAPEGVATRIWRPAWVPAGWHESDTDRISWLVISFAEFIREHEIYFGAEEAGACLVFTNGKKLPKQAWCSSAESALTMIRCWQMEEELQGPWI